MFNLLRRFRSNEDGATAIEYGLIAALVAVGGIVAFQNLGGEIANTFNSVEADLNDAEDQAETAAIASTAPTAD